MNVFERIKAQVGEQKDFNLEDAIAENNARRAAAEAQQPEHFRKQFAESKTKKLLGRSGILPLHQRCTVDNYEATTQGQVIARDFARDYILGFDRNDGQGFIFGGTKGTGKNHLAASICNALMLKEKSCLIITVSELMIKLRSCYGKMATTTEDKFIQTMVSFDLLILDEIGLQRGTDTEHLIINQIIDQRVCRMKPTGMLTNLEGSQVEEVLGERVFDRMRMNGGAWIEFNWNSYRK
ncbi:DnaC-like helicase loader [Vibrio phage douglas 12A4]|uniref:DnaC-like helicase loader n=1 Tax=Vibrio phage douglas 12A4 TaxID=573171 RepID=UPI0002C11099|nr:DnaC-like helicase loader [Vibrio phage douglas 12A4]AGG58081.1 hypothetical protein VPAG_00045 [Vibrio phage douglas 12A4]